MLKIFTTNIVYEIYKQDKIYSISKIAKYNPFVNCKQVVTKNPKKYIVDYRFHHLSSYCL
jgi:hypothetical protein